MCVKTSVQALAKLSKLDHKPATPFGNSSMEVPVPVPLVDGTTRNEILSEVRREYICCLSYSSTRLAGEPRWEILLLLLLSRPELVSRPRRDPSEDTDVASDSKTRPRAPPTSSLSRSAAEDSACSCESPCWLEVEEL
jgi:hypothetical protein